MRCVSQTVLLLGLALAGPVQAQGPVTDVDEKMVDRLEQLAGGPYPGARATHAKGVLVDGVFEPLPAAAGISRAAHFQPGSYPVLVRFSNNGGLPTIPDTDPRGQPQGVGLRFLLPNGDATDILMLSTRSFPVSSRADFLALIEAFIASGPQAPHSNAVEKFTASHPATARFFRGLPPPPRHYGTAQYFAISAFKFSNAQGQVRYGRYRLVPLVGFEAADPARYASLPPDYLSQALQTQLAAGPVRYRLLLQLAEAGDPVTDCTALWPDERPLIELGTLTLKGVFTDGVERQKRLAYNPLRLTDGIEDSGDPILKERSVNYPVSVSRRIASGE